MRSDLRARAEARRAGEIARARTDPAAFVSYAFPDEATGRRVINAPHHVAMQRFLTAHRYAVIIVPVEHGKTFQVGLGRNLWEVGRDPSIRSCLVSDTSGQAEKVLRGCRNHIEQNPRIREVFPHLRPTLREGEPWHGTMLTVDRPIVSRDPSLQACGMFGSINGSRLDRAFLDDIVDFESSRTHDQRKKSIEWIDTTVMHRLTDRACLWAVGTPWHPEDALHSLTKRPGFALMTLSAVSNPDDPPEHWQPIWPEQWPLERLLKRRAMMPESQFDKKLLCRLHLEHNSRFKRAWIDHAQALGKHLTMVNRPPRTPGGGPMRCFTGVDLGVGTGNNDALTVIFTIAIDERGRRQVCEIQAGKWGAPEILDRLGSVSQRFGSTIFVESNGAQKYLVQMAQGRFSCTGLFTSAQNKWHQEFGVESLAVELRNGWWLIPSGSDEVKAWISEMLHFDPAKHTGDRLMASWIAREGARRHGMPMLQRIDMQAR